MIPILRDLDICLFQGLKIWEQVLFPWLLVEFDLTRNDKTKLQNYKIFWDEKVVDYTLMVNQILWLFLELDGSDKHFYKKNYSKW